MANFKVIQNNKGIGLLELLISLSIMAILSAMVAPNFLHTIDRTRLRSDIQSARVIQNALELYIAETGKNMREINSTELVDRLVGSGHLQSRSSDPQTPYAAWILQGDLVKLDITSSDLSERTTSGLSDNEISLLEGFNRERE